ncbi:uncharacterized protein BT62DRAFT_1013075 [Guyanagaster necrorhizus]|uniref:Uncharacterized protein n=1 Tax=Guyanagaster necrorhizus TaxID=856835 RepID=A0A9P8ALU4_9AGAR|nr:uncharacterized protein BT62DRAFT_1013075 [Guyanagaster necrorhizus MCA 3950]KAG7440165.1 hypothetical protein BT62DRAFT_1013075 [Guyanagaster necrorhizus MCA 3950]
MNSPNLQTFHMALTSGIGALAAVLSDITDTVEIVMRSGMKLHGSGLGFVKAVASSWSRPPLQDSFQLLQQTGDA